MADKSKVAFYIGRFQPPHKGHIYAMQHILKEVKELVIGIGSAQYSHDLMNPFTTGERYTMLRLALDEAKIKRSRYAIFPVADTENHSVWVAQLLSITPKFEVIYSNDPLTSRLLKEAKFQIRKVPFFERKRLNATAVRKKILENETWDELVPSTVAKYIRQIGGVERIRDLAKFDRA
ncbi:MAG: nicotinamide-nucleotide adenylyltransferase [Candidatus Bathyarchaeota archaeon]